MMIDSLELDDAGRAAIVERCRARAEQRDRGHPRHRHDGRDRRARSPAARARRDHRPDRRDGALRVRQLGRPVQPRERAVVRAGAAARRLRRDERAAIPVGPVRKNRETGIFEALP